MNRKIYLKDKEFKKILKYLNISIPDKYTIPSIQWNESFEIEYIKKEMIK